MGDAQSKLKTVSAYSDAFRDMVNDCVSWKDNPGRRLKLTNEHEWSFVCVAMDILGDATAAIDHVLRFALDGPTKYDDTGEKYLRLYGVLGAAYSQQRAALKLHKLTNCPDVKGVKKRADALKITVLRHQIAAHSLDYFDTGSAYVPVRIALGGFSCTVTENRGDAWMVHDLKEAIAEHCDFMADLMDAIYEKCLKTFFKNNKSKQAEHLAKLEELRKIRAGWVVMHAGPVKIVIQPVSAKRTRTAGRTEVSPGNGEKNAADEV
ncbi:hypothetical protein [Lysobacter enzymogenes]|uniref:hypothetical protein n=1 Tax=Lysobacter enzymogenes TaxID=69 RepID=UPI001A971A55|nr:hypothetical protein [Lysobacter enzymogenes]QQP97966.1 hypothetical protein JHW38_08170 [Lysobacter enzymogenes]